MLADIKGPHLDFFRGGNSLSHGSGSRYSHNMNNMIYPMYTRMSSEKETA